MLVFTFKNKVLLLKSIDKLNLTILGTIRDFKIALYSQSCKGLQIFHSFGYWPSFIVKVHGFKDTIGDN